MLGDAPSALEELASLQPDSRNCTCVLELEWGIHAEREDWTAAAATAQRLIDLAPTHEFGWVHRAYALRRQPGGSVGHAREALLPALERFPRSQIIAYNLACYATQLGRPDEGWEWYLRAVQISGGTGQIRKMALLDPDLEPLWPRIRGLGTP